MHGFKKGTNYAPEKAVAKSITSYLCFLELRYLFD